MAKANDTTQSLSSQAVAEIPADPTATQKTSQAEEIAKIVSHILLFEPAKPSTIKQIFDCARNFTVSGDSYQAGCLAALKECLSSAESGKPMRLSPEMQRLNTSIFAAMLYEQVIVVAECHIEGIRAALERHAPWN